MGKWIAKVLEKASVKKAPHAGATTDKKSSQDPRPDIGADSHLWDAVLEVAKGEANLFGLLHGLRCHGAILEIEPNGSLKLDYKPLLDAWDKDKLLSEWLVPNHAKMAEVFEVIKERKKTGA